ncbi:MAG: RND transporter [Planctomycetia bacterium]|nr:RND transporter [Planctomycetia bacterium]
MKTCRFISIALLLALGCNGPTAPDTAKSNKEPVTTAGPADKKHEHTHDGWWCDEHGVPEEVCGLCNSKLAAEFQKKGDWCKEHDRPDSQCFLCHPELEAKFAAQYEAKYGKQPPKPKS